MNKLSSEAFKELHRNDQIRVDIFNTSDPDANPAPLVVSKPQANDLIENKFVLRLTNMSNKPLVLGGFRPVATGKKLNHAGGDQQFLIQPSGLYVNFSDMVNVFHLDRISVSIDGTPVHTQLRKLPSESDLPDDGSDLMPAVALAPPNHYVSSAKERDPSIPPLANPQHLGKEEYVLYIWPEKEKYLGIMSTLTIQFENVVSEFYPALRYLDVSWELKEDFLESAIENPPATQQGFHQLPIELTRPIGFVEPPLPIQATWLNNQNCIYTSQKEGKETYESSLKNELFFALSNVGLKDFILDCSKHSRGVPYFELVMTGEQDGEDGYASSAVAEASDLVNVEITNNSKHPNWKPAWNIQKKIQGPLVKWEIRPDLQKTPEGFRPDSKKILGTDMDATVTFRISNLVSKLEPGVALVYFRFYNMPQHDDGQLVLFLEKRRPGDKQYLVPQLQNGGNGIASPFYWRVEEVDKEGGEMGDKELKTFVTVGEEESDIPLEMELKGDFSMDGDLTFKGEIYPETKKGHTALDVRGEMWVGASNLGHAKKSKPGILKLSGSNDKDGNWRTVEIHAASDGEDSKTASKMIFRTRDNDYTLHDQMVIDSKGNVGVNNPNPESRLDVDGSVVVRNDLTFVYNNRQEFSNRTYQIKNKKSGKEFFNTINSDHQLNGIGPAKTNLEDFYWEFIDLKNKTNFIYEYLNGRV
ncbi:MAG: hypothetical protein GYB31_09690 [Bacteroidetes bacterium]|nr:hypothetical protein [Bacteroidota bacterium]